MRPNPQFPADSHLLKKSLMENFVFCAASVKYFDILITGFSTYIGYILEYISNKQKFWCRQK